MQNSVYPEWLSYRQEDGLRDIDVALGRFLYDICGPGDSDEISLLLSVLTSYQLVNGNPCLNLDDLYSKQANYLPPAWFDSQSGTYKIPDWLQLQKNEIITKLQNTKYVGDEYGLEPIALVGQNLYLRRYWLAAQNIVASINKRAVFNIDYLEQQVYLRQLLDTVFETSGSVMPEINWQKIACAVALVRQFAIITGGPGTGKTTTVVKLLSILQAVALNNGHGKGLRINLAAPTGKAAARLNESISNALQTLAFPGHGLLSNALALVPNTVITLHRLLGVQLNSRLFRHNEQNPLDLDVLVVDEASMMDIEMFDAVLRALPEHARLIILGDKDQLASVEAGAIMGELCARSEQAHYVGKSADLISALTGETIPVDLLDENGSKLDQSIVMLRKSYRFHENSGIGKLAAAINKSDIKAVHNLAGRYLSDIRFIKADNNNWFDVFFADNAYPALFERIRNNCPAINDGQHAWDNYALDILKLQEDMQILCAVHKGNWGTVAINNLVERRLKADGYIVTGNQWYAGRPVMVLRNRPDLGLANGDIGVTLMVPDPLDKDVKIARIAFVNSSNGKVLWVSPARLDQIETVYALTIHKSQGSEFKHVVLVLPDTFSPVMTKELLYTGVTRARNRLSIVTPDDFKIMDMAIKNPTRRSKALAPINQFYE